MIDEKVLNERNITIAKWIAVHDTGYMGRKPKNSADVKTIFNERSSEYAQELGEGLDEEFKMWLEAVEKDISESVLKIAKRDLPWLFEEVSK